MNHPFRSAFGLPLLLSTLLAACGGSTSELGGTNEGTGGGGEGDAGGARTEAGAGGARPEAGAAGAAGSFGLVPGTFVPPVGDTDGIDAGGFTPTEPEDGGGALPSPVIIDGCAELCAKEATASCPGQPPISDCRAGCSLVLANPKCSQAAEALLTCSKKAPPVCGGDGKAAIPGCEAEALSAAGCALASAVDPALTTPCTTYCGAVSAANCAQDSSSVECIATCTVLGNLIAGCAPNWSAYVRCAGSATMTCGNDGKAWAPTCAPEALRFLSCSAYVVRAVSASGDAGP